MIHLTQEQIDALIDCPKEITEPPKKSDSVSYGFRRNKFAAKGPSGLQFQVYIRQSEEFQEDFSVGICHKLPDGTPLTLMRCNGPHGRVETRKPGHPHYGCHVHRASEENIKALRKPEHGGIPTDAYETCKGALRHLLAECRIEWTTDQFPWLQITPHRDLFDKHADF